MKPIKVALVGCGGIALANHVPGLRLCPQARLAALCDQDGAVLEKAARATGVSTVFRNVEELLAFDGLDALIIATPNISHAAIALAAISRGKHVLCEKPLAMNLAESREMLAAAEKAGVRHMTAFTYRFVPAMRYMVHLVRSGWAGEPFHFRSCRLQDWGQRQVGWRQRKEMAGSGELGDMLSHRIDYAHMLLGLMARLVSDTRLFIPKREGAVSDAEDWVGMMATFQDGGTGMFESSKLATGRGEGGQSQDMCEINGREGSIVFQLEKPHQLWLAKKGESGLRAVAVPKEFLVWPGSTRDPDAGDPVATFRYDQDVEFINAIGEGRECHPSFREGVQAQCVIEAALNSAEQECWVRVDYPAEAKPSGKRPGNP